MLKKLNNKKGFTLMEMLIVVAIIAVLVAVAIPTFTSALNKAKAGTDLANIRSGYAAAQLEVMTVGGTGPYYLNDDGTVSLDSGTYKTKGASTDADNSAKVGGSLSVGTDVTWVKNKSIKYTIANGIVSTITAE